MVPFEAVALPPAGYGSVKRGHSIAKLQKVDEEAPRNGH